LDFQGEPASYTPSPFMMVMEKGKLLKAAAPTPAKKSSSASQGNYVSVVRSGSNIKRQPFGAALFFAPPKNPWVTWEVASSATVVVALICFDGC